MVTGSATSANILALVLKNILAIQNIQTIQHRGVKLIPVKAAIGTSSITAAPTRMITRIVKEAMRPERRAFAPAERLPGFVRSSSIMATVRPRKNFSFIIYFLRKAK